MKKWVRLFAIVIGAVVLLGALALAGLNLYVRLPGTQSQIEQKVGRSLGIPLKISGISLTPWGGLHVSSASIPQTDPGAGTGDFLETAECVARFKLLPLFAGRLEVTSVDIAEPKLVWAQNERGNWEPPSLEKRVQKKTNRPKEVKPGGKLETKPEANPETRPQTKTETATTVSKPEFTIRHLRVRRGEVDFLNAKHERVALFSDVEVKAPSITADSVSGTVRAATTSVAEVVFPKNFRASFAYKDDTFTLSNLEADAGGGRVSGNLTFHTSEDNSPYLADVRLENVDVNSLLSEGAAQSGQIEGVLNGWLNIYGDTDDPDMMGGSGQLVIRDGRLRGNEILQLIGRILQIEELERFELRKGRADFRISDGRVWVDELVLQSPNLTLTVHGTIRLSDGKITSDARLSVNEKMSAKIPDLILKQMKRPENGGGTYVDFTIKGSLDKPGTDLPERIIGDTIKSQVDDLFKGIFGKKKDKDEKKKPKKKDSPAPTPAPENRAPAQSGTAPLPPATPAPEPAPK